MGMGCGRLHTMSRLFSIYVHYLLTSLPVSLILLNEQWKYIYSVFSPGVHKLWLGYFIYIRPVCLARSNIRASCFCLTVAFWASLPRRMSCVTSLSCRIRTQNPSYSIRWPDYRHHHHSRVHPLQTAGQACHQYSAQGCHSASSEVCPLWAVRSRTDHWTLAAPKTVCEASVRDWLVMLCQPGFQANSSSMTTCLAALDDDISSACKRQACSLPYSHPTCSLQKKIKKNS